MSHKPAYDLIIFTARFEEQFFLKTHFANRKDPHYNRIFEIEPSKKTKNLHIGLVNIGAMGNVASAIDVFEVLEHTLPRAVAMIGLAGGYKPPQGSPTLRMGDVGIAKEIFYHSYGKIGNDGKLNIRSKISMVPLRGNLQPCESEIQQPAFLKGISNKVHKWWESTAYGKNNWLKTVSQTEINDDYINQKEPNETINVVTVCASSGEVVIANNKQSESIREAYKAHGVSLFEMESYGIAQVCEKFEIPFLLCKGISDYADSPMEEKNDQQAVEEDGKGDKSRWRAIAAASSVLIELLESGFLEIMVNSSNPKHPNAKAISCLHPNGKIICRNAQQCINSGLSLYPAQLCRTFENVNPATFSTEFEKAIQSLVKKDASITTFFPYSKADLMKMFLALYNGKYKEYVNNIDAAGTDEQRIQALRNLFNKSRFDFTHFLTLNKICNPCSGEHTNKIVRIIVSDDFSDKSDEEIKMDPRNAIFPLLFGRYVPTYYATAIHKLKQYEASLSDITFIEHKYKCRNIDSDNAVVLRFIENSQILIVSNVCSNDKEPNENQSKAIKNLYNAWKGSLDEKTAAFTGWFTEFPMKAIAEKWKLPEE